MNECALKYCGLPQNKNTKNPCCDRWWCRRFFCAINAARLNPSLKVTIVEKSNKLLSKVKISGGGRCNVTHACFDISELIKHYPRGQNFLKKCFHWFSTEDTIKWFRERGVLLKTEEDGRMFPVTDNSQTIIDCLLREASKHAVEIVLNRDVKKIETPLNSGSQIQSVASEILKKQKPFRIFFSDLPAHPDQPGGTFVDADIVCIACGGYPKSSQFEWLKQTTHTIQEPVPSLFTFNIPGDTITTLKGVSVEKATVKIQSTKFTETGPLLITHWGLSGPAVLKLSAWGAKELSAMQYNFIVHVNWLPSYNENSLRDNWQQLRKKFSSQKISSKNPFGLPNRLWTYFLDSCSIGHEMHWADLSSAQQNKLIKTLTGQAFEVKGKTTFKEEFVTSGGIQLQEIDANTMQSKIIPGLFFAGEVMNVDGITGGFNFQHAWTSGWIAANCIGTVS